MTEIIINQFGSDHFRNEIMVAEKKKKYYKKKEEKAKKK